MEKKASLPSMELQLSSLTLLFAFALLLHMLVKHRKGKKAYKLPPGPWKLPLLGNLHQLVGALPHYSMRDLAKKHGPIMHLKLGEVSAVIISSAAMAKEVFKTNELAFAERPEVLAVEIQSYGRSGLFLSPYSDYWRQIRKLCVLELLSNKRVRSFRSIREEEVWSLIESVALSKNQAVNLSEKIFALVNNITARASVGKKCEDQAEFISCLKETLKVGAGFNIADLFPSLKFLGSVTGLRSALENIHRKTDKMMEKIIEDHKMERKARGPSNDKHENEDLVDVLLDIQEANDLQVNITTNQIKAILMDIFVAGSDTSATTVDWAMSELLKSPRVMAKAQAEVREAFKGKKRIEETDIQRLEYLKLVVKETLRMHPASPVVAREAREKCGIDGYEIPTKTKLIVNVWAIARDPGLWRDPDCFKPERFYESSIDFKGTSYELLPFGAGRRMCPGVSFANAIIELVLAQMLYHFNWKLPNGIKSEDLDMTEEMGATIRRKNDLHLIATPYIDILN